MVLRFIGLLGLLLMLTSIPAQAGQDGPLLLAQDTDDDPQPEDYLIPNDALPSLEKRQPEPDADAQPLSGPPPEILRDVSVIPQPVARMRELLLEAARTGELEALRSLMGVGPDGTVLSIGGLEGDPIDFLRSNAGDSEGFEILGILVDVLESGFARMNAGEDDEIYVWPYFATRRLDSLTPPQKVELYRILTAGDVLESEEFGAYVFYRLGITPDGEWKFFIAGD